MMDNCCCLICNRKFASIYDVKKHLFSGKHHGRKKEIFKKDILKAPGFLPYIIVFRVLSDKPFVGLSMLTFCCSVEDNISFYLCHVCGEKCSSNRIVPHVFSGSHYSNYLNYTDPDSLRFAWTPSAHAHRRIILCTSMQRKLFANGFGQLQVLDVPADLLKVLESKIYSEVMQHLNENQELSMQMEGSTPKRVTIQTYLKDSERKHPLLGLQHLIECVCTGNPSKAYYLCTLCKLSVSSLMIIKHVLSFDHIHSYFKVLHPSTLLSKECYRDYSKTFSSQMLNFAKQSEEINATVNTDMKHVVMGPDVFASVNFASYTEASKRLSSIRSDGKKSSFITTVKPGKRLEIRDTLAAPATSAASAPSASHAASATSAAYPASASSATPQSSAVSLASTRPAAAGSSAVCPAPARPPVSAEPRASEAAQVATTAEAESALSHDVRCQNCSTIFNTTQDYYKHLATTGHKNMLKKYFNKGATNGPEPKEWTHRIGLFLQLKEGLRTNTPVVGVPLIVSCISTEAEVKPVYLCFACKDCFSENRLTQHLNSTMHLIHVLLYHNPWRLPFAWEKKLDVTLLRLTAMEEEKERGPDLMLVKILDVPYRIFFKFCYSFEKVMRVLQLYHTLLMHAVPRRETYRKLNNHDRFPLLGQEFMVMHHKSELRYEDTDVVFLCLLCERTLSNEESYAHVFSREHIASFLERFHPGSLNSDTASELLDLARQAARIHPVSHLQVIRGEWPTGKPYTYHQAKLVLTSLKYKDGRGQLLPQIVPKRKLVPRAVTEDVDQKRCRKSNQNGLEMQTCEKHLLHSDTGNIIKRPSGEIPSSSENESKNGKDLTSQSCSEQITNECSATLQGIKEEKIEKSIKQEPTETATESFLNVARDITVTADIERISAQSESQVNLVGTTHTATPGKCFTTVQSAEEMGSNENIEEKYQAEQHFNFKQEPSCEELLTLPIIKNEKNNTDKAVGTGPRQKALTDTGVTEAEGQAQQNIHPEPNPTSAVSAVQLMDILGVLEMEEDTEVQHSSVNESVAVESESTSNTAKFPTKIKVPASNTHLSLFRSTKVQLKPADLANSTRVHQDSRGNGSNTKLIKKATAAHKHKHKHTSAACKLVETSHSEKNVNCDVSTSTKSAKSALANASCRFGRPSSTEETDKSKTCNWSHKTSSSSRSTSIASHKSREILCELAATTTKRPATSSDSSPHSKMSKSSEHEVKSRAWHIPSTAVASVECGDNVASPKPLKNSVQANPEVNPDCTPEAPHSTSQVLIRSKQKYPANQPSCDSVSKPAKKAPYVGLNQLIVVSCQSKRQVYCKLCSVKLNCSSHVRDDRHKHNYVKKFFGVTDKLPPEVLDKVVSSLSDAERDLGSHNCQTVNVSMDTYKELQDLPARKALATLKEMLAHKDSSVFSSVTHISPGFLSPDDEMEPASKRDVSKAVHQTGRVTVTKRTETVESSGQLSSCLPSSRNDRTGPTGVQDVEKAAQKMDAYHDGQNRPAACISRKQQLERSTGHLQVKEILSESTDTSRGKVSGLDLLFSASGIAEQQSHQRTDHNSKPVPKSSVKNTGVSVAKSHSLSIGERIHASSNLSVLLMVHQTPIVGLSSIWECRGISSSQLPSFYLCESCVDKLSIEVICKHMNSTSHQLAYLTKHYPRDMLFWGEKDLSHVAKLSGLKNVVSLLSKHESYAKMDAQVVLLREDLYKCIQAAPVSEALKLVQSVTRGPNPELRRALHEYDKSKQAEKNLMDEDKQGRMLCPKDVVSVSGKTDAVVSSIVSASQDPVKKISLEQESEAKMSLHQMSVTDSPSSSVSPQKSVTSRPADESLESLIAPQNTKAPLDAFVSGSEAQPSTGSVFESTQSSHASPSTPLFPNTTDSSLKQDLFGLHRSECINLISIIKNMKHTGENASSQTSAESSCLQPPSQRKVGRWNSEDGASAPTVASREDPLVGYVAPPEELVPYSVSPNDTREKQRGRNVPSQSVDINESQVTSSLGVEGNRISGQLSWPQSVAETEGTGVCQRPLNYAEVNEEHQLARPLSAPASRHYGWRSRTVNDTHRQVSSSAEAVNTTPESNTLGVFPVNQIIAGQEATGFGRLGSQTAPGDIGLEVQQQQMQQQMQQILQLLHQQQILQQQLQCQMQQQQQMHQLQMQQPQMYQGPQYQMYQPQSTQEQVQQQYPMQPLINQYQIYQHQRQQQISPNEKYEQRYGQSSTGTSMALNQSSLPSPAQMLNLMSTEFHQRSATENLVMQNISPSGHEEHDPSPSTTPSMPAAHRPDISHMPFSANHQH